jgi:hypothetical protein
LEYASGGDENIPPAVDTILDGSMDLVNAFILGEIDMQYVRIVDI